MALIDRNRSRRAASAPWTPPKEWLEAPANTIQYADNPTGYFATSEVGQQIMGMLSARPRKPPPASDPRSGSNTAGHAAVKKWESLPVVRESEAALRWGLQSGHIGHRGSNSSFLKTAAPLLMAAGPFLSAAGVFGGAASGAAGAVPGYSQAQFAADMAAQGFPPGTFSSVAGAAAAPVAAQGGYGGGALPSPAAAPKAAGLLGGISKMSTSEKILAGLTGATVATQGVGYIETRQARKDAEAQAEAERQRLAAIQAELERAVPLVDDEAARRQRRRSISALRRRGGRASTILTGGEGEALGA